MLLHQLKEGKGNKKGRELSENLELHLAKKLIEFLNSDE
jgi:hypothetical protein